MCASAPIAFIPLESFVMPLKVMLLEIMVGGYEGDVILIKGGILSLSGNRTNLRGEA